MESGTVGPGGVSLPQPPSGQVEGATGHGMAPTNGECVMMGMTNSGKTKLLMAIHRACHLQAEGEPGLDFVPVGWETAALIRRSVDVMMGKQRDAATQENFSYQFQLVLRQNDDTKRLKPPRQSTNFFVTDPPGEALFPLGPTDARMSRFADELVHQGRRASSILLCVDMTSDQTPLFRYLPERLGEMATEQSVPYNEPWFRRLLGQSSAPQYYRQRLLACDRFLVLLTKADQVVDAAYRRMKEHAQYFRPGQSFRPMDLAPLCSPVEQARDLLGIEVLSSIISLLKPGAHFAVGISSAGGFDVSGLPFLDHRGLPSGDATPSGPEILRRWIPFGVREAMLFAAFGIYSPAVQEVTAQHLLSERIREREIVSLF